MGIKEDFMDKDKFVTFEMFKKYHEHLMNFIENGDSLDFDVDEYDDDDDDEEV